MESGDHVSDLHILYDCLFREFGLIEVPEKVREKMKGGIKKCD